MSKRGNGEGSVYQRQDGRWVGALTLEDGKRKSIYGRTRRDVQAAMTRVARDLQLGISPSDDRRTVGQFLDRWLVDVAAPRIRPKTLRAYEQFIRLHLIPELGKLRLSKLGPEDVQAMLNRKRASGLSPRSVHHIRAVLRTALNHAIRWGYVPRNAAALADAPQVPHFEVQPLTPEQARVFLDSVKEDRLGALYITALGLGLRQGEALGITWADVDLDKRTLRVSHTLQRIGGEFTFMEPKTARSRRAIPLPDFVAVALRAHRTRQLQERLQSGGLWENGWDLVFTTPQGTPQDAAPVRRRLHRLLVRAGLPSQRFHDLRHACASLLVALGVDLRIVMQVLGHTTITTTANIYTHVLPALERDAVDRLDALLSGGALADAAGRR